MTESERRKGRNEGRDREEGGRRTQTRTGPELSHVIKVFMAAAKESAKCEDDKRGVGVRPLAHSAMPDGEDSGQRSIDDDAPTPRGRTEGLNEGGRGRGGRVRAGSRPRFVLLVPLLPSQSVSQSVGRLLRFSKTTLTRRHPRRTAAYLPSFSPLSAVMFFNRFRGTRGGDPNLHLF